MADHIPSASDSDAPFDLDDPIPDPLAHWRPPPGASLRDRFDQLLKDRRDRAPTRSIALMAMVALVIGVGWWLLRPPAPPIEAAIPLAADTSIAEGSASAGSPPGSGDAVGSGATGNTTGVPTDVVVQAAGAVGKPGVYRLPTGSRVDDLVTAAGGLSSDADTDRVNLATLLADGQRIFVPRVGEDPPEVVAGAEVSPPAGVPAGSENQPSVVNLNTATAEDLDTLPGVGPSTAAAILSYREEHGTFSSVDELLEVRGIGDAKLEAMRDLVAV